MKLIDAWSEDRALLRSNPSAASGTKTEEFAVLHEGRALPLRDWSQSAKPSGHDARIFTDTKSPQLRFKPTADFQFPLNQHAITVAY